jgi:hypothetical protein
LTIVWKLVTAIALDWVSVDFTNVAKVLQNWNILVVFLVICLELIAREISGQAFQGVSKNDRGAEKSWNSIQPHVWLKRIAEFFEHFMIFLVLLWKPNFSTSIFWSILGHSTKNRSAIYQQIPNRILCSIPQCWKCCVPSEQVSTF